MLGQVAYHNVHTMGPAWSYPVEVATSCSREEVGETGGEPTVVRLAARLLSVAAVL